MKQYTMEQADALDWIEANDGILLLEAGAGAGKTFLAKEVVELLQPKSGIYTAFNKAIVEEGVERFHNTNIECKTLHALAYRYVQPKGGIAELTYKCITEDISYPDKRRIIEATNAFYVSAHIDMYEFFEVVFDDSEQKEMFIELSAKYVNSMVDGAIKPSFNFLLKYLHLMLHEGTVSIDVDLVIFDEINDATAVTLEIFRLINAPKKVGLGETNQAIYQFLNLVNGFEVLADYATTMRLTQSFRCSTAIAKRIENCMKKNLREDFKFIGTDEPLRNDKTLYCTGTNAAIVEKIASRLCNNQSFKLLRKPVDIFAPLLAVSSAASGKKPYQRKYEYLFDIYKDFKAQSKHKTYTAYLLSVIDDNEIESAVGILSKFRKENINVFDIYKRCKDIKEDESYTIATVYTSKGMEYETVYIAEDLNSQFKDACKKQYPTSGDELTAMRCYYVACSRAGVNLLNALL